MRKKIEWQWEALDESTKRAKVIGGWIVMRIHAVEIAREKKGSHKIEFKESMVFIPDKDHEWTIVPPIVQSETSKSTIKETGFEPK